MLARKGGLVFGLALILLSIMNQSGGRNMADGQDYPASRDALLSQYERRRNAGEAMSEGRGMTDKPKPSRKTENSRCLHEPEHPIEIREVNGANRIGEEPKPYAGRTIAVCKICRAVYIP